MARITTGGAGDFTLHAGRGAGGIGFGADVFGTPMVVETEGPRRLELFAPRLAITVTVTGEGLSYEDVTRDGRTVPTPAEGLVRGLRIESGATFVEFAFAVDAADWLRVTRTARPGDDRALLREAFSGDDRIVMEGFGHDRLDGFDGSDVIRAGRGRDRIEGGWGEDRLFGEEGADRLSGGGDRDRLDGGHGDDVLEGGAGRDVLIGGPGADSFLYAARRQGRDRVLDFTQGEDVVTIDLRGVAAFEDLAVLARGGHAAVRFAGTLVVFEGVAPGALTEADFEFV